MALQGTFMRAKLLLFVISFTALVSSKTQNISLNTQPKPLNILMISLFVTPSHKIMFNAVQEALHVHGHTSTLVTMYKGKHIPEGMTEIVVDNVGKKSEAQLPNFFTTKLSELEIMSIWFSLGVDLCDDVYNHPQIKHLVNGSYDTPYDLVIMDGMNNECVLPIANHLGVPHVYLFTHFPYYYGAYALNIPSPYAHVPALTVPYTDTMTFFQRLHNAFVHLMGTRNQHSTITKLNKIVRKHMPNSPLIEDLMANTSLVLVNTNFVTNYMKPLMPHVLSIGGIQLKEAKPLPKDLQTFADESGPSGFIYVSFGTLVKSSDMTTEDRQAFLRALIKTNRKVIWKFETEFEDLPDSIKIVKWAPQNDILGHHNCRLFVGHGGDFGLLESQYHGVPVIGIPFFGDQLSNLERIKHFGIGTVLDKNDLSEIALYNGFMQILNDDSYQKAARAIGKLIHDEPDKPADRVLSWIEYVVRQGGAPHLRRSGAKSLSLYQYLLLDVIAFAIVSGSILLYTAYWLVSTIAVQSKSKPKKE